jgi:glycosyltransferase involved in cell wall biosynthesis
MASGRPLRTVLLISNTVMHYRVSVYNYFWRRFREDGYDFQVLTNRMQSQNQILPQFCFEEIPFHFRAYRRAVLERRPAAVILFLHLKDRMFWPLVHWLKWRRIPVAFWTKTRNLGELDSRLRNALFDYMLWLHDGLILYSADLIKNVSKRGRHKAFPANNTINFEDFPDVSESKDQIKRQLGIPFKKVVLFAGRMDVDGGRKRVDHLIEIFRDINGRDAGLVIVGSGLKEEWRARMNPQTTIYLGEIHDPQNLQISRVFKMADVSAIPGHVGLGLNQAFYFGLPVVTEEGNHPPEIGYLKPGRNGFIVPENDLARLREKLFTLLDNDAMRLEFSRNAREDILRNASTEGMYRGFRDCVCFLDGGKREVADRTGGLVNPSQQDKREIV